MDNFAALGEALLSVSLQLSSLSTRFHLLSLILLAFSWFVFASLPLIAHSLLLLGVPWRPGLNCVFFFFWRKATKVSSSLWKRHYIEVLFSIPCKKQKPKTKQPIYGNVSESLLEKHAAVKIESAPCDVTKCPGTSPSHVSGQTI